MKKLSNIEVELKKRVANKEKKHVEKIQRCPFADALQKNCP